jgi:phenylacetate-CoA ligase
MIDSEALYRKLPVPLQNLACNWEGWRIQRNRYNRTFWKLLQAAESRDTLSTDQLFSLRDARLSAFVHHAAETVPYYKALFQQIGLNVSDIRSLQDLRYLPLLTKDEARQIGSRLESAAVLPRSRMMVHTSGTTGGGFRFASTFAATQEQWAVWWRFRRRHGIQPGTWCGYFGGRSQVPLAQTTPPFWRINQPGRQILFSGYHMSSAWLDSYVEKLQHARPPWLHGYPSLLTLLAAHLIDRGGSLDYPVRWITTGAENLFPHQKLQIQRAFGVAPIQHYGMAEAVANFSECERGFLHVDEDFSAVEFIPNSTGSGFSIVGTNFTNPATPLLRYTIQDIATLMTKGCTCGRAGRVVAEVDGRLEDYVVLRNGSRLGRLDHIFKDLVNIREAQIHQDRVGHCTIRVARRLGYGPKDEEALRASAIQRLGQDFVIDIIYLDSLPKTANGKLRLVISEISGSAN